MMIKMNFQMIFRLANKWRTLTALLLLVSWVEAQEIPQPMSPARLVNDFVGILNGTERETLEQKLRRYNDSTSTQLTIVIVETTDPYPIGDYAFELGRRWGVGQKGKNNGLVLVWATKARKVYIATGYGMEGVIPDAIAKRIISDVITPSFKNAMYYQGLDRAADEIAKYASGEHKADPSAEEGLPAEAIIFMIFFFIIMIFIFSRMSGRGGGNRHNRNDGMGGGGWFPYVTYSDWGSSSGSWGDSGGGGSDFGGFGGGDFGGGGAGGDY
jgi:uncharacterized protein